MKLHTLVLPMLLCVTTPLMAFDGEGRRHHKQPEFLQNMSQEERAAFEEIRDKMKSMSKEERMAFKKKVKDKWAQLSEDEKQSFIKEHETQIDKALERQKQRIIMRMYGVKLLKQEDL